MMKDQVKAVRATPAIDQFQWRPGFLVSRQHSKVCRLSQIAASATIQWTRDVEMGVRQLVCSSEEAGEPAKEGPARLGHINFSHMFCVAKS